MGMVIEAFFFLFFFLNSSHSACAVQTKAG